MPVVIEQDIVLEPVLHVAAALSYRGLHAERDAQ
jgi:hypothetical protein